MNTSRHKAASPGISRADLRTLERARERVADMNGMLLFAKYITPEQVQLCKHVKFAAYRDLVALGMGAEARLLVASTRVQADGTWDGPR